MMMMMVVEKGAAGGDGGGVGDDMGEGMRCNDHPYRNNPGGICAFCLQEKLGKLISSSKSIPSFPSSSSSSPSYRSEGGGGLGSSSSVSFLVPHSSSFTTTTTINSININTNNNNNDYSGSHHLRRARMTPFLPHQNDKAKKVVMASSDANLVLERSKSSSVTRRQYFDANEYSPRKKKFWSFFNLSTRRRSNRDGESTTTTTTQSATSAVAVAAPAGRDKGVESSSTMRGEYVDDDESPNSSHTSSSSFGRKVARSRSVGCGSRSFSGDFLERISTGFGDCTLRRVESQRETKPKSVLHHHRSTPAANAADEAQRIKERVKCGGIFGGFSTSYWQQSSSAAVVVAAATPHSRNKSWGWAFASPMRAFTRPSSSTKADDKDGSRRDVQVTPSKDSTTTTTSGATSETTPNLAAIPSLLTVRV
ncbi:uncharacterized serine-rich protein C215.13-like [Telopea speciosissima]|uniref:uncharacterized serine-rich protein C215.13-like n=1 Tax=Telopea speciosissima TaxID=54955 RepID=UPI001CC4FDED|nr:uncharacterized serine-rich protein C215.13-like [Telopea speciosissima]